MNYSEKTDMSEAKLALDKEFERRKLVDDLNNNSSFNLNAVYCIVPKTPDLLESYSQAIDFKR